MNKPVVLVIDDEVQISKLLSITLASDGYAVQTAFSAREGIAMAASYKPGLIILDIGLPDMSGHEVLRQLREWYTQPIIILSVLNNEEDIVKALDNGANDYLTKPFRTRELLARMRSCLRSSITDTESQPLLYGDLIIDLAGHAVTRRGELVKLTATEFALLALLVRNEGKVLTHQYLLREIWGVGYLSQSQYLRVFIAQLRKKIEENPDRPTLIRTESGIGYRFYSKD